MARKTARIERTPGESVLIDDTRVRLVKVKGRTWLEIEHDETVKVSREDGKKPHTVIAKEVDVRS